MHDVSDEARQRFLRPQMPVPEAALPDRRRQGDDVQMIGHQAVRKKVAPVVARVYV